MELSKREGDKFIKALKDAVDGKKCYPLYQESQHAEKETAVVKGG